MWSYLLSQEKVRRKKRLLSYNVPSEVDVGEFLVDVLDGGLHAFICEDGRPLLRVCTGL